ncbi:MAG TPA: class I SAM-dependent methyltransferase [Slackia equolifaciens]|uniref:Demethylmenaquinone methyltransferase n=1 Tax=Slackia equolifaciens TaxID=498718 RepID=A0A9D2UY76_9ACTN|nr:class I SAM-dependent methyltransferase [Slackia equolifaciens]
MTTRPSNGTDTTETNASPYAQAASDVREKTSGEYLREAARASVASNAPADIHAGHTVVDTATGQEASAVVSEDRVKEIFGAIAKKYDRFNAASSFGLYKRWLNETVKAAALTPSSNLLDLAGGTGDVSYTAAKLTPPAHIQLTDFVPEMLDVARDRARQGAACGVAVDFDVVDAQDIPYADDSYDSITMAYGIRNIPDREQALAETYRVLKPGGTFACLEFSTPPNPLWRGLYYIYLKTMIPFWGKVFTGDAKGFVYLANSIRAFPDQKTFADMLEKAGFVDVSWKNLAGGIVAVHTAHKRA